ncbi:MAG: hypothetical protein ABI947_18745 [Chloroflexota bacterium]
MKSSVVDAERQQPPVSRLALFFGVMLILVLFIVGLTGFLVYNGFRAPRHEAKAFIVGVNAAAFVTIQAENSFPLGLASAADGTTYLSLFGTGAILKVDAQGQPAPWIAEKSGITAGGALAVGLDKAVYVIDYTSSNPGQAIGSLKRITPDGTISNFGVTPNNKDLPLFAQLAFDNSGALFVTNPSTAEIWRFEPGGVSRVWWIAPAVNNVNGQPTGIVYDAARQALVIGDAGTGSIYRVAIDVDGKAGISQLLEQKSGLEIQALALDNQGRVLFTDWDRDNGELKRLEANGGVTALADGFRAPTALIYRDKKVYVVNSDLLGITPPILGFIPSPLRARPPFTVDVVTLAE